ncbi:hypothetical protein BN439_0557 [Erwinia amylovora Ea644]|nr:hypothetical protein BN439_0557 [Erwinia amylovora Ea644]
MQPEAIPRSFRPFTFSRPLRQHGDHPPFSLLQLLLLRLKLLLHCPQPPLLAAVGDRQPSSTVRLTPVPTANPASASHLPAILTCGVSRSPPFGR